MMQRENGLTKIKGNMGGAIAGFIIRKDGARRYVADHGVLLLMTTASCILTVLMTWHLRRENARRDRLHGSPASYAREGKMLEAEYGSHAPFFRYIV